MGSPDNVSPADKGLLRLLTKHKLLSQAQAEAFQPGSLGPIGWAASQGFLDSKVALSKIAAVLGLDVLKTDSNSALRIAQVLEHPAINKISLNRWRQLRAIPLKVTETCIDVGVINPIDHEIKSTLEFDLGKSVKLIAAPEDFVLSVLSSQANESALLDLGSVGQDDDVTALDSRFEGMELESNVISGDPSAPPIIRIVNKIFAEAVQAGGSDIHITPEKDGLNVKVRVDGILQSLFTVPAGAKNLVTSRIKLLCGMDIAERRRPQDGRLRLQTPLGTKDLRVSVVPAVHGENIVARILSSDVVNISFESLGMPAELKERFVQVLKGTSRVVLVAGPTGSGKTSTLYASLLHLKTGRSNIITIEDPIEYRLAGITQIQVQNKIGMTFAETLRSVLRQDPDVIMVGEVRDKETAAISMQAAQTGHLVLSTIHTNSAPAAITRLRDLGTPSYLVASSVGCVVGQRLIRRLCSHCKRALRPDEIAAQPSLKTLGSRLDLMELDIQTLQTSSGCNECHQTGFRGRTGIFSLLEVGEELREVIRAEGDEGQLSELAASRGYLSLEAEGLKLLRQGVTSLEEIERVLGAITLFEAAGIGEARHSSGKVIEPAQTARTGIQKRKILLVEDDENTRTILSMLLEKELFEVIEAKDGLEGLEQVYSSAPELIVTDLMMPKLTGLELVQRLRSDPLTRKIPVLLLTAASSEENEVNSITGGADDFVSKTAESKVFLARVRRLLDRAL